MYILDLSDALRSPEGHIINRMLGSPKDLVYLTLKKGDVIQAKQVIKMYKVEGKSIFVLVSGSFFKKFSCWYGNVE